MSAVILVGIAHSEPVACGTWVVCSGTTGETWVFHEVHRAWLGRVMGRGKASPQVWEAAP